MPIPPPPTLAELDEAARALGVAPAGEPLRTAACLLQTGRWQGLDVMLKLTHEPEELRGLEALRRWDGRGAVRVLAVHEGAAVLERADEPVRLALPDDAAVTTELCATAARLHATGASTDHLPHLREHLRSLDADSDPRFDVARRFAGELLRPRPDDVLLHGDVHGENVLTSARGPLAIDPKGVVGPAAFDAANLFTNWTAAEAHQHFDARLEIVGAATGLDEELLLRWIVVWSATSGLWHVEDGDAAAAAFPHGVMDLALARLGPFPGGVSATG